MRAGAAITASRAVIGVRLAIVVKDVKNILQTMHNPDGFNIGITCGIHAGQTVMHAPIHVMPRYKGDVSNPRGVVRHIIPGEG